MKLRLCERIAFLCELYSVNQKRRISLENLHFCRSQVESLEKKCKFAFDTLSKTKEEMVALKEQVASLTESNDVLTAEKESLTMAMDRQKEVHPDMFFLAFWGKFFAWEIRGTELNEN